MIGAVPAVSASCQVAPSSTETCFSTAMEQVPRPGIATGGTMSFFEESTASEVREWMNTWPKFTQALAGRTSSSDSVRSIESSPNVLIGIGFGKLGIADDVGELPAAVRRAERLAMASSSVHFSLPFSGPLPSRSYQPSGSPGAVWPSKLPFQVHMPTRMFPVAPS